MNPYAPIINVNDFGIHNMLSVLKSECEHVTYLSKGKFDFQVMFSENEDFNAVAYEIGNRSYINVSIATIMQIYHHVLLLMKREELLPKIGEEVLFKGKYRIEEFDVPEICQYNREFKQIAFYEGPDNPKRKKIAELIALFGMEFMMFHELGHHIGGHLRFLKETLGVQRLYAQGNSIVIDSKVYQMLETDADAIAIATLLESISTKIKFYKEYFLNGVEELIPHCVIIAVTTVFFLMEREDYFYNIDNAKYLPRDMRFMLVIRILMDKIKGVYKICGFSQTSEELVKTLNISNDLLGELYANKEIDRKILFHEQNSIKEYYNRTLLPLWKEIRNELEKYAVILLPE